MTDLTNVTPSQSYGDILTLGSANVGSGLTNVLVNVQDGLGNNSSMQISTIAVNFNRTGGNSFQLDGISLTAPTANINAICAATPNFNFSTSALVLPTGNTAERPGVPTPGDIRYNAQTDQIEAYLIATGWTNL